MAGEVNVDIGTGTKVGFATSSFTADLTGLTWSGISRESIETSHMETAAPGADEFGNRTFVPGDLSDPGELTMQIHFNPGTLPPIDQPAEVITITWPLTKNQTVAATWASEGFITDYNPDDPLEDKMTASITVKFSGNVTKTLGTT